MASKTPCGMLKAHANCQFKVHCTFKETIRPDDCPNFAAACEYKKTVRDPNKCKFCDKTIHYAIAK